MSLALEQKPGAGVDVPEGAQQGSLGARGVCRGDLGPWSQGRANGRRGGHGWGEATWGLLCAGGISTMCSVALPGRAGCCAQGWGGAFCGGLELAVQRTKKGRATWSLSFRACEQGPQPQGGGTRGRPSVLSSPRRSRCKHPTA